MLRPGPKLILYLNKIKAPGVSGYGAQFNRASGFSVGTQTDSSSRAGVGVTAVVPL